MAGPYTRGGPPSDGWGMHQSGLFVPGQVVEGLQKAVEEGKKEQRGKFFSDRGEAKSQNWLGTPAEVPTDSPEYGQFLSYYSLYQPWNLAGGFRKPTDTVPFSFLRDVARKSVIDRLIVDTRIAQMKHFARPVIVPGVQVGFRVVHERHKDPAFHEDDAIKARCAEVQRRICNVTPEVHNSIRDFFTMMIEEELVIDRKAIVIYRDREGRPEHFHAVDGATIRPRLQVILPWMFKNKVFNMDLAAEIMSYEHKVDITKASYVQEVDGQYVAAWTAEQMSIDVTNPTAQVNHYGYGLSLLEKSLEATKAFVYAWQFNTELFKTNYPEAILAILGDYDPVGLETFKRQILGEVGPGSNWRLPVIPGGPGDQFKVEVQKLRDTPQEMLFGELMRMLVAIKAGAYRMHPSEINFSSDMGAQNSIFGRSDTETEVANAVEEGLHTLMDSMADWLTRAIVKQNYDDLVMIWDGLNRPDENTLIANLSAETAAYKTVDEARAERNMSPLADGMGEYINNPLFFQMQQMKMQEEQMKQQQEQYEQGDFGQPPIEGEDGPEAQESGEDGSPQEWLAQKGAQPTSAPGAKGEGNDEEEAREPGQMPPEGNPRGAPMMNQAARGKAGKKPFEKAISFEDYETWRKSLDSNLKQYRQGKGKRLIITNLDGE